MSACSVRGAPPARRRRQESVQEEKMLEIGVFHNGASSLPVITTKDGVTVNDGSLAEVHRGGAGDAGEPGPPGHPRREAGLPVVLADRAPFPAGRRGDEPEPADDADGDRRADQADPARPVRQHRRLAPSGAARRADRAARRDQRRAGRMRHRPRLPAARERDARPALWLDDPGPGAQPQGLRGGGRDHQEVLDRAVVRRITARTSRFRRPTPSGTTSRRSPISRWTRSSAGWRT